MPLHEPDPYLFSFSLWGQRAEGREILHVAQPGAVSGTMTPEHHQERPLWSQD